MFLETCSFSGLAMQTVTFFSCHILSLRGTSLDGRKREKEFECNEQFKHYFSSSRKDDVLREVQSELGQILLFASEELSVLLVKSSAVTTELSLLQSYIIKQSNPERTFINSRSRSIKNHRK